MRSEIKWAISKIKMALPSSWTIHTGERPHSLYTQMRICVHHKERNLMRDTHRRETSCTVHTGEASCAVHTGEEPHALYTQERILCTVHTEEKPYVLYTPERNPIHCIHRRETSCINHKVASRNAWCIVYTGEPHVSNTLDFPHRREAS